MIPHCSNNKANKRFAPVYEFIQGDLRKKKNRVLPINEVTFYKITSK